MLTFNIYKPTKLTLGDDEQKPKPAEINNKSIKLIDQ